MCAFTPSRRRNINSVLGHGIERVATTRVCAPSLIPGEPTDKAQHIAAASGVNPLVSL